MKTLILLLIISANLFAQNSKNEKITKSWDSTFKSEVLSTYFKKEDLKVILLYSGENNEELDIAYKSLLHSLKEIKTIKSILPNKMLGNTLNLDDKSIVKRANFLDVNYIIIMRIFKDNESFSVVVSLYDKKGNLVTGIFSEKGIEVSPNTKDDTTKIEEEKYTSTQLNEQKTESTSDTTKIEDKKSQNEKNIDVIDNILKHKIEDNRKVNEKVDEFNENYLSFEEVSLIDLNKGIIVDSWSNPIVGKYKKEISWTEFYNKVGRKDLADKYKTAKVTSYILFVTSIATFVSSYFLMGQEDDPYTNAEIEALPLGSDRRSEMRDANFNHDESRMFTPLSIGFIVVGVLSGITGAFMLKYQPVKSYEARKLADKHNKNLKKKLGLDNNYIPEKTSNKIDFKFSIAPYAGKNTGGLLLNVDF